MEAKEALTSRKELFGRIAAAVEEVRVLRAHLFGADQAKVAAVLKLMRNHIMLFLSKEQNSLITVLTEMAVKVGLSPIRQGFYDLALVFCEIRLKRFNLVE